MQRIGEIMKDLNEIPKGQVALVTFRREADALLHAPPKMHPYPARATQVYTDRVLAKIASTKRARGYGDDMNPDEYNEITGAAAIYSQWLYAVSADCREYITVIRFFGNERVWSTDADDKARLSRLAENFDLLLRQYEGEMGGTITWMPKQFRTNGSQPETLPDRTVVEYSRHWLERTLPATG
jgi:hypothetical protein